MTAATSLARSQARPVLSLYRTLLRMHRGKLPPPMRSLGDSYVRHEFQSHLRGKTTMEQWQEFMTQWRGYRDMLAGQADVTAASGGHVAPSGALRPDAEAAMTPEQRQRMQQLREEITRLGKDE